ncbi:hypothetical protein KI440_01330 [Candidatus Saccharibacteria bacterium TM7i]|nr:hypothetical protein KI440_01330 [Candidatus Saccharibacteria bacterium TM7i]
MGCHDRESNYNALKYHEEKGCWLAGWSPGIRSIEALDRDRVIEKIGSGWPGASIDDWDIVQLDSGSWKATYKVRVP